MPKQLQQNQYYVGHGKTLLRSEEVSRLLPVFELALSWDVARVEFLVLVLALAHTLVDRRYCH